MSNNNTKATGPSRAVSILAVLVLLTLAIYLVGKRNAHESAEGVSSPSATVASDPASSHPAVAPPPSPASPAASAVATQAASSSAPSSPASASSAPSQKLAGDQLAHAWLRGYLTRPAGAKDQSWTKAIAPLSDPALVETLAQADNPVGLEWPAWRVAAIKPAPGGQNARNTVSRHTSRWLVTIQGPGSNSAVRLYEVTSYLGDNGWSVAQAQQGYFSNG